MPPPKEKVVIQVSLTRGQQLLTTEKKKKTFNINKMSEYPSFTLIKVCCDELETFPAEKK